MSDQSPQPEANDDDAPLGDAGKRALEAERTARKDAERRAREAEERLSAIEVRETRASVAAKKGLTEAQAALLRGQSSEELESEADEMLAAFAPLEQSRLPRLPRERLTPGAAPGSAPAKDMGDVADEIVRGW
jgi:hypothetical protein